MRGGEEGVPHNHPGSPLPTTKEWGEGKGEGRPKERRSCGNEPLSPLASRGEGARIVADGGGAGFRTRDAGASSLRKERCVYAALWLLMIH